MGYEDEQQGHRERCIELTSVCEIEVKNRGQLGYAGQGQFLLSPKCPKLMMTWFEIHDSSKLVRRRSKFFFWR